MKVKELIKILEGLNQNLEIYNNIYDGAYCKAKGISVVKLKRDLVPLVGDSYCIDDNIGDVIGVILD